MHDAISIRPARVADAAVIVEFNRGLAWETEGLTLAAQTVRNGVSAALADPGKCQYFVAEIAGRVAGQTMVTYEWSDWRNAYFWWIQSVYVDARFRRQGVFSTLYRHVQKLAREATDCCGLRLYVEQSNQRARHAYSRLGLHPTGYLVLEDDGTGRAPTAD
jgi:GNAT superfamily N-acetyltransferase